MSWTSSIFYLPIVILLTSLSFFEYGVAELVNLKASMNQQLDEIVDAPISIVNTSLQLDLDTIMDNTENLIGVLGFVRDTNGNNTVDLSTFNDTSKDEENKRLWSILCPEKGEEMLNIVSRTEWGADLNVTSQRRTQTADLLIVDSHTYVAYNMDYTATLRAQCTFIMEHFGDLDYNFWISDDGKVFEGIGWNSFNYIHNGGLGPRSLIIGFIKKKKDAKPSAAAITAFKEFVRTAVCMKTLSVSYSLVPYYVVNDYYSIGKDSFERKGMRSWYSYKDNLDFLFPLGRVEKHAQFVPKEEWMSKNLKGDLMTLSFPIEYIFIHRCNARCFFNCAKYLNVLERYYEVRNEAIPYNFLVSEEGRVYEVTGWGETWHESYHSMNAIQVGILGSFESYVPNKHLFLAFNSLIRDGLSSGKLCRHYQLLEI